VGGHDQLLDARVEAAGEDDVGGELQVLQVLLRRGTTLRRMAWKPKQAPGFTHFATLSKYAR
jgi:hypothetical protein